VAGWKDVHAAALQKLPGVGNLLPRHLGTDSLWEVSLHVENSREVLPGIVDILNHNGTRLANLNIVRPSLEDVFIQLTGKALRD